MTEPLTTGRPTSKGRPTNDGRTLQGGAIAAAHPEERHDEGYTLVETVVALALLLLVLLPAASGLLYLAARPDVRLEMEALERAQNAVEVTLQEAPGEWVSGVEEEGGWRVVREVDRRSALVVVTVRIGRETAGPDLAVLTTARFLAPDP